MKTDFTSVDHYIGSFPNDIQVILEKLRAIVMDSVPEAVESIAYGMPAYKTQGKPLVYFAAFKKHIGFYALPSGHSEFSQALSGYKQGKGSVQFPIDDVPFDLIRSIVLFRKRENELLKK